MPGFIGLKPPPEIDGEFGSEMSSVSFTPPEGLKSEEFMTRDINGLFFSSSCTSEKQSCLRFFFLSRNSCRSWDVVTSLSNVECQESALTFLFFCSSLMRRSSSVAFGSPKKTTSGRPDPMFMNFLLPLSLLELSSILTSSSIESANFDTLLVTLLCIYAGISD